MMTNKCVLRFDEGGAGNYGKLPNITEEHATQPPTLLAYHLPGVCLTPKCFPTRVVGSARS